MALVTECQTPGANVVTRIHKIDDTTVVSVAFDLPFRLELTEEQADQLERNMHNAMELVLAPFFMDMVEA